MILVIERGRSLKHRHTIANKILEILTPPKAPEHRRNPSIRTWSSNQKID